MADFNEEQWLEIPKKVDKIGDDVRDIRMLLRGYNGTKGLCDTVEVNSKRIRIIELTLAILFGSGALGGGAIALLKVFG